MSTSQTTRPERQGPYPELTWVALVTGWFIGVIIAVAIGYAARIRGVSI